MSNQIWTTPISLIPEEYKTKIITYNGETRSWEDILKDNPDYEVYTDINGKPITLAQYNKYKQVQNQDMLAPGIKPKLEITPEDRYRAYDQAAMANPANPYNATLGWIGTNASIIPLAISGTVAPIATGLGVAGDFLGQYIGNKISDNLFRNPDKPFKINYDIQLTPREVMQQGTGAILGTATSLAGTPITKGFNTYRLQRSMNKAIRRQDDANLTQYDSSHSALSNKTRFKVGDVEVNDPNLNYRLGEGIISDFMRTGKVRTRNSEFSRPHFNQGELWGSAGRLRAKASAPELLVTRESLQNRSSDPLIQALETRRFPYTESQLNRNNTSAFVWENNYGWRNIDHLDRTAEYLGPTIDGQEYITNPTHLDFGRRIGVGGEQSVFSSRTNPNIVYKVRSEDRVFYTPREIDTDNNIWMLRNQNPSSLPIEYKGFFKDSKTQQLYPVYTQEKVMPIGDDSMSFENFSTFLNKLIKDMKSKGWVYKDGKFTNGKLTTGDINPGNLGIDKNGNIKILDGQTY